MLDHVSIQCADVDACSAFYDPFWFPSVAAASWTSARSSGRLAGARSSGGETNRELHVAFGAPDRATVRAFFDGAVAAGAEILHEPRMWPEYDPDYYGSFVRDPDGNNVEAVCRTAQ